MKTNNVSKSIYAIILLFASFALVACVQERETQAPETAGAESASVELTDAEIENIVRRTYQFVAMYNVNNKGVLDTSNPAATGGWNEIKANTALLDHTMTAIARPNNDTLYVQAGLDLRAEPMILEAPAFDSKYISLMATGYDHYVNIPMSTRQGHFSESSRILFYSDRTESYDGEPVDGIDIIMRIYAPDLEKFATWTPPVAERLD